MAEEKDPQDAPVAKDEAQWAAADPTTAASEADSSSSVEQTDSKPAKDDSSAEQSVLDVKAAEPAAAKPTTAEPTTAAFPPVPGESEVPQEGTQFEGTQFEGGTPKKSSKRLLAWTGAGVAAIVFIAAIAAAVFYYLQYNDKRDILDAQASARQAACDYGPILADYDFNNWDSYVKKVLDSSTGEFKKQFTDTSKELKDVMQQGQVKSVASDTKCAITSGDKNHAVAIIVIGQSITSVGTKGQPQPGQISMVATLDKIDGRWMVEKMDSPIAKPQ